MQKVCITNNKVRKLNRITDRVNPIQRPGMTNQIAPANGPSFSTNQNRELPKHWTAEGTIKSGDPPASTLGPAATQMLLFFV